LPLTGLLLDVAISSSSLTGSSDVPLAVENPYILNK
jgi:hypothetical protein